MFPELPRLPTLPSMAGRYSPAQDFGGFLPGPGGVGIGFPGGGPAIGINLPPITVGSGGSKTTIGGTIAGAAGSALSSALGIPAINWGRIAAFLLGLLLIGGGLYLIKQVNQSIKVVARTGREVGTAIGAAAE